jgi:PEP-CTERM motif
MEESVFKATCKIAVALVVIVLGTASGARADGVDLLSISQFSNSDNVLYLYGLTTNCSQTGAGAGRCTKLIFQQDKTVTISGLSGVTGASVSGALAKVFDVESFTPTSVTFQMDVTSCSQTGAGAGRPCQISVSGLFTGDFNVDSTVLTVGKVDWSAQTLNEGDLSATVEGPVGSVPAPEPSSVVLMLLGVGLVFVLRKRDSRGHQLAA